MGSALLSHKSWSSSKKSMACNCRGMVFSSLPLLSVPVRTVEATAEAAAVAVKVDEHADRRAIINIITAVQE